MSNRTAIAPAWRRAQDIALPAGTMIALLVFWEILVRGLKVPVFVLPPPTAIIVSLWKFAHTPVALTSLANTMSSMLAGFLAGTIVGVACAALIYSSKFLSRTLHPLLLAIQTIPKITIAPLLLVWFGIGVAPKIILITIIAFFPVLTNMLTGLASVDQKRVDLFRALGANRWQEMTKLRFPASLPYLFAALEVTAIYSLIGAIIVEFVGSQGGLGTILMKRNYDLDIAGEFAIIAVLSALGILLHGIIKFVERRTVFWTGTQAATEKANIISL